MKFVVLTPTPFAYSASQGQTQTTQFLVGLTAGGLNGAMLSPLSVVKYYGWGSAQGQTFFRVAAKEIHAKGGVQVFFKGVTATIGRDVIFGVCYELSRNSLKRLFGITTLDLGWSVA